VKEQFSSIDIINGNGPVKYNLSIP